MRVRQIILFLLLVATGGGALVPAFSAGWRGLVWEYLATVESRDGPPIQVRIELISLGLETTQPEVAIVRTPWQTDVKVFQWAAESEFEIMAMECKKAACIFAWCWPGQMFELLPILEEPFPYFSQLLRLLWELPFTFEEENEETVRITFFASGPIKLDQSKLIARFGIDIKFDKRTFVETEVGKFNLLPVQFEVIGSATYTFTVWCLPHDLPALLGAPIKGEGKVKEAGVVTTEFGWELVGFKDLGSAEIQEKLEQALEEMAQTAPVKAEEIRGILRDLGIEIPS